MATLEDIHSAQFNMFQYFDELCSRLGIRYCMVAGTLLGAVRHRGFIPWDDDIDVYMSLEDAKKLEKSFHSEDYFLQTPETDPESSYIMLRLRINGTYMPQPPVDPVVNIHKGVWLDIFVYTDAGRSKAAKKLQLNLMRALQSYRCRWYHAKAHPNKKAHAFLTKLPKGLALSIDRGLLSAIKVLGAKKSGEIFALDVREPYFFPKRYFENMVRYPFEGGEFWGIRDYDSYLSSFYGSDYMTPKKWGHIADYSQVRL